MTRIYVLGADPSGKQAGTGWALVGAGLRGVAELLDAGKVAPHGREIEAVLDAAFARAALDLGVGDPSITLAIESQFITRPGAVGAKVGEAFTREADRAIQGRASSAIQTAAARGRWLGLAEANEWRVVELLPAQWRATLSLPPRAKRPECKRAARASVELRHGHKWKSKAIKGRISGDVAEAVLIAEYQARVEQLSALGG